MRVARVDVDVVHLGYAPEVQARRGKRERNLALLRERCATEPHSVTPCGYLALELLFHGDVPAAAAVVERGWALVPSQPRDVSLLRLAVARAILAVEAETPDRALEAIDLAERREGAHADLSHLRGRALALRALAADASARERALDGAAAAFRAALAFGDGAEHRQYVAGASSWASLAGLGEVMLCRGRSDEALAAFRGALARCPGDAEAALGVVEALLTAQPAAALARVERHLDARPDGWLLAAAAARALSALDDARLFAATAVARRAARFRSPRRAAWLPALAQDLDVRCE
jgi:tetratricopeptide (TPR) repeat protein